MSCSGCPYLNYLWLDLKYFKCPKCGNVWLDHPSEAEAWKCPSCGGRAELIQ